MLNFVGGHWWQWLSGPAAFLSTLLLTPLIIRLAHRMGWLAYPKADRWHDRPTALMGGIAIYLAVSLAILLFTSEGIPWPIWAGASVMFAAGLVDDLKNVKPFAKLIPQVAATGMLMYGGYVFGPEWSLWISIPVTFLWVIGITNAINLLDNMDGLAAGISGIAAFVLAIYAMLTGSIGTAVVAVAVAGGAAGFLVFNFKPARIFMGDCGSLFLGFSVASLAVAIQSQPEGAGGFAVYLVSAAVLAVPIFDTTLVIILRTLSGRSVAQGGRDHSSHRLVFLGLSERQAVLTLYAISALFGSLALLFQVAAVTLFFAVLAMMGVALVVFGVHLSEAQVYGGSTQTLLPISGLQKLFLVLHAFFGVNNWKHIGAIFADLLLIISAFILAHHLRFEGGISPAHEEHLMLALPVIAAVKMVVFYWGGLYRAIWRHAGMPEVIRIGAASVVASSLSFVALGLLMGFESLSRGVALIDWMIVTISVTGVRLGFRGLRHYISSKPVSGRRVLLYGAGDAGLLALREIRQNPHLDLIPVVFADDDPSKRGLRVQGFRVAGGLDDLEQLCRSYAVEEVLITAFCMNDERRFRICMECDRIGVDCRSFHIAFVPVEVAVTSSDGASVEVAGIPGLK